MVNNRELVEKDVIASNSKYILTELPTSYGKTKISLEWMKSRLKNIDNPSILIVVPKLVLIQNWKDEIVKWGYSEYLPYILFTTYVSFPKRSNHYNIVIFDECHHLSDRCIESLDTFIMDNAILLSATVNRNKKVQLRMVFHNLEIIKITAKQAIKEEILPDPMIYLIPLTLDRENITEEIIVNKTKGYPIVCNFKDRWKYKSQKARKVIIRCTQFQYYNDLSSLIIYYKNRAYMQRYKNLYLQKCGERLKWLSEKKTDIVRTILSYLKDERILTFCNGIEQTENLGQYCINSKNDESRMNLNAFNNHEINHITACNMLDEGINLADCRIGIYAMLNSSERIIKQRLGRILRHPSPIIIIPYFVKTRDEEIINKMKEDYNPELIRIITNLEQLQNI